MKLYDGIDQRWVETKDITPPQIETDGEYPPVRSRAEFDRAIEQEKEQSNAYVIGVDWSSSPSYTVTHTVKREHA